MRLIHSPEPRLCRTPRNAHQEPQVTPSKELQGTSLLGMPAISPSERKVRAQLTFVLRSGGCGEARINRLIYHFSHRASLACWFACSVSAGKDVMFCP
jgi:hypothetical protein